MCLRMIAPFLPSTSALSWLRQARLLVNSISSSLSNLFTSWFELTAQHGDELRPAGKTFGITLSGVLFDECSELGSGKVLGQWFERAGGWYNCIALLWAGLGEFRTRNVSRRKL